MMTSPRRPVLNMNLTGSPKLSSAPPSSYTPVKALPDNVNYPHVSVFRSSRIEIHIHSPSTKVYPKLSERYGGRPLPVFGDHDVVEGAVVLDTRKAMSSGRLTITLEGSFVHISPDVDAQDPTTRRHNFYSSSIVCPINILATSRSTSSLREAFTASVRPRRARTPSLSMNSSPRSFPFSFKFPRSSRIGEELPPTFSSVVVAQSAPRGRTSVERTEVTYRVLALWETQDINERTLLEAPILFQPDTDFQSLDGLALEPASWLEIPLKSDRSVPFKCAMTVPDPATFPRSASIPYFVVFTTTPRSSSLAREIATDATIVVSLLRRVNPSPTVVRPSPSPSSTSSSFSDEAESPSTSSWLRKRVPRSASAFSRSSFFEDNDSGKRSFSFKKADVTSRDKPLPPTPPNSLSEVHGKSETRTLHTDVCIGFPKRPRHRCEPHQRHPSLDTHASLPDGLYKGKLQLDKNMLPAIDWAGMGVQYYLEVSVLFGQDECRARVPVRIF